MGLAQQSLGDGDLGFVQHSAPRTRVLDAALDLFAEYGVSGTSLQMIADGVGITKAAVYQQFRTKDHIILAAIERELGRLVPALRGSRGAWRGVTSPRGAIGSRD